MTWHDKFADYSEIANFASAAANWVIAVTAILAFFVAVRKLRHDEKISNQNQAEASYRDYMQMAVQYPNLARGIVRREENRYPSFISFLLFSLEKIAVFMANDANWNTWSNTIKYELNIHKNYLNDPEKFKIEEFITFYDGFRVIMDEVLSRNFGDEIARSVALSSSGKAAEQGAG